MKIRKSFSFLIGSFLCLSSVFGQIASPPTVVGDLSICLSGSAVLTANDPTNTPGATFRWYIDQPLLLPDIFIQESDSIVLGPLLVSGNYKVQTVNPSNGQTSALTNFTVTVDLLSTNVDVVAATPNPLVICNGESATYQATSVLGSTSFRWYDALTGGNLLFEGTGTNEYTTGPLGIAPTVYVSGLIASGCESPRVLAVPPVVTPTLQVPVAIADPAVICSGDTSRLYTLNKPANTTVRWYDAILGGNELFVGDTFLLDVENTGSSNLAETYFVEFEDANGCRSLRTPVVLTILPALDVPLVNPPLQTICTGDSAEFTASSLLGSPTYKWYDALLGGNLLATGPVFNTGAINNTGTTDLTRMYYVSVEDANGCESVRVPVTVVILPALDLPVITPPAQQACPGDSVDFSAVGLLGGSTVRWYDELVGGNLLATGPNFNTGPLNNPGTGNITEIFYAEIEDDNGCRSLRAPATVIILPTPAVPTYTPLNPIICNGDSVEFTASSIPDLAGYNWYDQLDAQTPIATGSTFNTGAIVNSGATDLLRTYFLEGVDDDGCRTLRIPVTLTIRPAIDVPLITPLTDIICTGDSVEFTASSLLGSGITYYWYDAPTGGNLLNQGETFNTGPIQNSGATDLNRTYWVELEDQDGCRSVRTPATVVIRPALDVPIANPPVNTVCNGEAAEFVGTSLLGSIEEYRWYDELLGGNLLFTGDTFNTGPVSNSTGTEVTQIFYLEAQDTAGCVSLRTPATLVVVPALDLPIVAEPLQVICNGQSAEFVATSLLGNTEFEWYDALVGGNLLATGDTFNTGPLTNSSGTDLVFDYYVQVNDSNGCESLRLPVSAIIRPNLDVPVVTPPLQIVCNGEAGEFVANSVGNIAGQDVTFNWYDALIGGNLIFTGDTFVTPNLTNNTGTNFTANYFVEAVDTNGCQSIRVPVTLIIRPALDLPLVTPPIDVICTGDSAQFIATSLLGSANEFFWYDSVLAGNLLFTGDTFNTGPINNSGAADLNRTYFVELEDTLGCRSVRLPVSLIIRPSLVVPTVAPPLSFVCQGDSVQLVASSLIDAEYKWYDSLVGGNLLFEGDTFISGPLTNASGTDLDTLFYVEAVDTAGCISPVRNFGTVIIRPALDLPIATPLADTVCSGGSVEFVATSLLGTGVNFYWYNDLLGGTPIFVGDTFRTQVNSNGSPIDVVRNFYVEVEDATGCRSLRTPVTVVITPGLIPPIVNPITQRICSGTQATITASSLLGSSEFFWYENISGGSPIFVGDTFVTDTLENNGLGDIARTFFVEQRDSATGGCASIRVPATVIVTRSPDSPTIDNPLQTICSGDSVQFIASGPEDIPGTIYWYDTQNGNNLLFVGDTFNTGALTNNSGLPALEDFFAEFRDTTGCISTRTAARVIIQSLLDLPTASPGNQTVCSGGDATVVGNSINPSVETYNWYDQATGGNPIFTGDTLVLMNLQNNSSLPQTQIFYVQSVDSAGCTSGRTPFTVTVQPASIRPTVNPAAPTICTASNVTLTADSDFGDDGTYYWYNEIGDANPVFVGKQYTTPKLYNFTGNLTQEDYFVQVEDTVGCVSNFRTVVVTVTTNGDDVLAAFEEKPVCHGNPAVLTALSSKGFNVFKWYSGPTDTLPFFEGDTLRTTPLFADTVFYLSSFNGDCSSKRQRIDVPTLEVNTLGRPLVSCVENPDAESVTFQWDPVQGAVSYEVSVNGGQSWKNPSDPANLRHTEVQLNDEDRGVRLVVRAVQIPTSCSDEFGPLSQEVFCSFQEFGGGTEIFNSFSPNGDGINDTWFISEGLEKFPDNEVTIFNRWGQEVFNTRGYDNDRNVFTGEGLEDGAYFYVVRVPSLGEERTGYVMIIR